MHAFWRVLKAGPTVSPREGPSAGFMCVGFHRMTKRIPRTSLWQHIIRRRRSNGTDLLLNFRTALNVTKESTMTK